MNDGNIDDILEFAETYAPEKVKQILEYVEHRPSDVLKEILGLYEACSFTECIEMMKGNILSQKVAYDFYHMALGYICLCYGHMQLFENCRLILEEMEKVPVPENYVEFAREWERKMTRDLESVAIARNVYLEEEAFLKEREDKLRELRTKKPAPEPEED